jgi:hypothetical protein
MIPSAHDIANVICISNGGKLCFAGVYEEISRVIAARNKTRAATLGSFGPIAIVRIKDTKAVSKSI